LGGVTDMDPILTKYVREPNGFTLDFYLKHDGYAALKTALGKKPDEIIEMVKASGLRGRGGAGFPTGMKWQFVDKKAEPRYIACNADESEPGTFKDHVLMERNPHLLFEGCLIGCWAIGAKVAYIYIRGEFIREREILQLLADGMSNADVAQQLFISQETVKSHVRHILAKLEAETRTQAVAIALREAMID